MFWERWKQKCRVEEKEDNNLEQNEKMMAARQRLLEAVNGLREGRENCLAVIYQSLAFEDASYRKLAAEVISEYMEQLTPSRIVRLDERFRQYTSMEWWIDWEQVSVTEWQKSIKNNQVYLNVTRLGTMHPNGYFREQCICALQRDTRSLPYLLLRLNDWVEPVRTNAVNSVKQCIQNADVETLIQALPFLEKVKQGRRRTNDTFAQIESTIVQKIEEQINALNLSTINTYDFRIKKYLYFLLLSRKSINRENANMLLSLERNSNCKEIIMRSILDFYDYSVKDLDEYLYNKSVVVRRKALERKYELLKCAWDGLEEMLLDSSRGIRETVCYILQKWTNFDITAFYRENLRTEHCAVAVLGIGENGTEEDAVLVLEFLQSDSEKIVRNCIKALSRLQGAKAEEIYWKYLMDERIAVAKSAYLAVVACSVKYGAERLYNALLKGQQDFTRRYLLLLLVREPSWSALPYLLTLYHYEDVSLQDKIRKAIQWRSYFGRVSSAEAENIREILNNPQYGIPEKEKQAIAFDLKYVTK